MSVSRRQQLRHDTKHLALMVRRALDKLERGQTQRARDELASAVERADEVRLLVWRRGPIG